MKLAYCRGDVPNFGDDLNRDIWPTLAPDLFRDPADGRTFLGIGTIIGRPVDAGRHLHVFTSGAGYDPPSLPEGKTTVWCVRGPLSGMAVGQPDATLTDGGVLSPLVYGRPANADGALGRPVVIPHWQSLNYPGWLEACAQAGLTFVDPRGEPREVVAQIAGASVVVTESLHGAIVADAYGIPWVTFATTKNFSIFKWKDWTLSMDLPLRAAVVPPPSVEALLAFGRPGHPYGHVREVDEREAFEALSAISRQPVHCPAGRSLSRLLKDAGRGFLKRSPASSWLAGYNPSRTARHLRRLAEGEHQLSREGLRRERQEQLLERLESLRKAVSPALV